MKYWLLLVAMAAFYHVTAQETDCTEAQRQFSIQSNREITEGEVAVLEDDYTRFYVGENYTDVKWSNGHEGNSTDIDSGGFLRVVAKTPEGCLVNDEIYVNYRYRYFKLNKDTVAICSNLGSSLSLIWRNSTNINDFTIEWSNGDTTRYTSFRKPGTYTLQVTNNITGEVQYDTLEVVYNIPETPVISDTVICRGDAAELKASGVEPGLKYVWLSEHSSSHLNNLEQEGGDTFITPSLEESTRYLVAFTPEESDESYRCYGATDTVNVIVEGPLKPYIVNTSTTVNLGDSIQMEVFDQDSMFYNWSPGVDFNDSTIASPVIYPKEDVTYNLTVSDKYGCQEEDNISFTVKNGLDIYNTFSPNNDGRYDAFQVGNIESYPGNEVWIYSRQGKLLTRFRDYKNDWEGVVNGKLLSPGVYFYRVDRPGFKPETGSLNLIK